MENINLTEIIIVFIQLILVPFVAFALNALKRFIEAKTNNEFVEKYLLMATDAISDAVLEVKQTYVDNIKGTDGWSEATQKRALSMAKDKALASIGVDGVEIISTVVGDFEAWLDTKLEATISLNK
jgi:hypothetical protein